MRQLLGVMRLSALLTELDKSVLVLQKKILPACFPVLTSYFVSRHITSRHIPCFPAAGPME